MTPQEILNKVVAAMRAQKQPAVDAAGNCQYRTANNLRCAVGHLPPDNLLNQEGSVYKIILPVELRDHVDLLHLLQNDHDAPANDGTDAEDWLSEFERRARSTAARQGLEYPA